MLSKTLGAIFALSPILGIYMIGIPILSLSQILLLSISLICLGGCRKKVKVFFSSFIIYALVITFLRLPLSWVVMNDSIHDVLSLILFYIILFSVVTYADYETFKKTIQRLGIVCLVFFIVQYILFLFDIRISGIIPFLPLSNEEPTTTFIAKQIGRDRLSALFEEPAHYSEFMIIFLIFVLFSDKQNIRMKILALLISFTIYLTGSATGFAMVVIVWLFWVFIFQLRSSKHKTLYLLGVSFILFVSVVMAVRSEGIMNIFGRFSEISGEVSGEHGRSSYIRVVRGYIPFIESNFLYKIFGNGLGNLLGYIKSNPHSSYLMLTDYNPKWINGVQYLLFSTGIVGSILYFSQVLKFYFKTSAIGKMLIVCLVLMFLSSDSFFSVGLLLYIIIKEISVKRLKYKSLN